MSVSSMTGFTRASGHHGGFGWTWEVRSVNGKGLDVRVRLPAGYEALEAEVRELAGKILRRGSVFVSLVPDRAAAEGAYRVNSDLLERLMDTASHLSDDIRIAPDPPRVDALLAVRGVVEPAEDEVDPEAMEARHKAMNGSLREALQTLATVRRAEGAKLEELLRDRLAEIDSLCAAAETAAAARKEALRERLKQQVEELLEMSPALPEERLAQEAAVLAVKADVREELDRLKAHVEGARALLDEGVAIGRRLDFLCQEFNREANTLCAKSGDIELTRIGLQLKAVIDQFREQALNIE